MDQRFHPRFRLARNVDVGIAYGQTSFTGQLVDFSKGGLQVTLHKPADDGMRQTPLQWQFNMDEAQGRGLGNAVRIQSLLSGNTRVGMVVPAANITVEGKCFQEIVNVLSNDETAGAIRLTRSLASEYRPVIEVIGKLHARLARDFTRLLADGCAAVNLSQCRDIDSGGIGLLAIAHDVGVEITGAKGRVDSLLSTVDRFRRQNAARQSSGNTRFPPRGPGLRH